MAKYNEILVGRFARFLQKLTGIKGPVPVSQLSGEIMAVLPLFLGVEGRYLDSWDRYTVLFNVAAVAANTSAGRLRNPSNSNVVAVIEKLVYFNATGGGSNHLGSQGAIGTDLNTAGTGNRLDPRGRPNSALIVSFQNSTPAIADLGPPGGNFSLVNLVANTNFEQIVTENQEIPLLPGDAIQVRQTGVNQPEQFAMFWRERFLEEGERT